MTKRWGGDLIVFVVSLVLALVVWGVMKLSGSYHYVYHYQVKISSPLEGRVLNSVSTDPLILRGSSSGFYLLRYKNTLGGSGNVLSFRVNPSVLKPFPGKQDAFYMRASVLRESLNDLLDGSVAVEGILSDTLVFVIPTTFHKKVPVCLKKDITYAPEYMPLERLSLVPDSVTIMGERSLVEGIDSVFTKKISGRSLKESIRGETDIEPIEGITMSSTEAVYYLKIGRYVERSLNLGVEARNVPQGYNMLLVPSSVKLTFREEYGQKHPLQAKDFAAFVDYQDASASSAGKVKVGVDCLRAGVLSVSVEPVFVERIIIE